VETKEEVEVGEWPETNEVLRQGKSKIWQKTIQKSSENSSKIERKLNQIRRK
jgi:hypothetical protein